MAEYSKKEHNVLTAGGGLDVVLREFVYKAAKPGKTIYIQSGLHGGETSQWVLYRLNRFLLENLHCGEVHIVPYANPLAWMQRVYGSTFGKFGLLDGKDFNRCFPGNAEGDVTARLCAKLMELAASADFVIDLHTSKHSKPFAVYTQKAYEPMVKACGLPYNQYSDDAAVVALHGTFNAALDRAGVANLTLECGSHDYYNEKNTEEAYQAICSLLGFFGLADSVPVTAQKIYSFEKRQKVFSAAGGLFKPEVLPRCKVSAGETIGHLYGSSDLADVVEVKAPYDGVILTLSAGHIVWEGDVLAEIIPSDDLREIC